MSNFFLPNPGTVTTSVAKYRVIETYDQNGVLIEFKNDLEFIKIGHSNYYLKSRMASCNLKTIDYKLLDYIEYQLKKDKDLVTLNPTIIKRYIDRQHSAISGSIKRLIQEDYIAKVTGRCQYQINPLLFFKGDRIKYLEAIDPLLIREV